MRIAEIIKMTKYGRLYFPKMNAMDSHPSSPTCSSRTFHPPSYSGIYFPALESRAWMVSLWLVQPEEHSGSYDAIWLPEFSFGPWLPCCEDMPRTHGESTYRYSSSQSQLGSQLTAGINKTHEYRKSQMIPALRLSLPAEAPFLVYWEETIHFCCTVSKFLILIISEHNKWLFQCNKF